jgi:hypothetical protein
MLFGQCKVADRIGVQTEFQLIARYEWDGSKSKPQEKYGYRRNEKPLEGMSTEHKNAWAPEVSRTEFSSKGQFF